MTTFTLTRHIPATAPRLTFHGLWQGLRARFAVAQAPALTAGPLGQAESAIYARGMLGWRG